MPGQKSMTLPPAAVLKVTKLFHNGERVNAVRLDYADGVIGGDVLYHGVITRSHISDRAGMERQVRQLADTIDSLPPEVGDMERVPNAPAEMIEFYDLESEGTGGYVVVVRAPYRTKRGRG